MEQLLIMRLHSFIIQNNPDLLLSLEGERRVSDYLEQKVATVGPLIDRLIETDTAPYFIEEECMDVLTRDLRPSKFHYLSNILSKEYPSFYFRLQEAGTLTYEIANLIALTIGLFEDLGFSEENENNPTLNDALKTAIDKYFKKTQAL